MTLPLSRPKFTLPNLNLPPPISLVDNSHPTHVSLSSSSSSTTAVDPKYSCNNISSDELVLPISSRKCNIYPLPRWHRLHPFFFLSLQHTYPCTTVPLPKQQCTHHSLTLEWFSRWIFVAIHMFSADFSPKTGLAGPSFFFSFIHFSPWATTNPVSFYPTQVSTMWGTTGHCFGLNRLTMLLEAAFSLSMSIGALDFLVHDTPQFLIRRSQQHCHLLSLMIEMPTAGMLSIIYLPHYLFWSDDEFDDRKVMPRIWKWSKVSFSYSCFFLGNEIRSFTAKWW